MCKVSVDASALKIHLSKSAHSAITAFKEFITESRGEVAVKVKYNCYIMYVHVCMCVSVFVYQNKLILENSDFIMLSI